MSWSVHEVRPLPDPVAQAQDVYGDRLNILLVTFLAGHPASTLGAILGAVGSERGTLRRHLRELETAGVVAVDVPAGQRHHTHPRYTVVRERWVELGLRLISYPPGDPAEQPTFFTPPMKAPRPPAPPRQPAGGAGRSR